MILTEQKINRLGRSYWRGSKNNSWKESQINFNCFYVSTNPVYAASYAKDEADNYHYLNQYFLKEKINIFNMRYKKDEEKLKDFLRVHGLLYMMDLLKYLKDDDWLNVLSIQEREIFIELLKQLNYDGFFNIECVGGTIKRNSMTFVSTKDETDLYGFSGIGIFDKEYLKFNKDYYGWEQIKTIKDIEEERNTQFNYLRSFLVHSWEPNQPFDIQEISYRFFLLNKKEIENIVSNFDYEKEKTTLEENYKKSRLYKLKSLRDLERSRFDIR